jgi:glucose-1-phosphate cytidylyltransferase
MKVIILAGGLGTRISEETETKPKPMVLLDDKPIRWHLMNIYATQGFHEFIIATGYKGEVIYDWVSKDLKESWDVTPLDTGSETMTGGRIKKCMQLVPGERVLATYGDGLGNVNIKKLIEYHETRSRKATVTAVRPPARFGVLETENGLVKHFGEKNQADAGWINGGFFVLESEVANMIKTDLDLFETKTLPELTGSNQLAAYNHEGFWQPMDTLREKEILSDLAKKTNPPWLLKSETRT